MLPQAHQVGERYRIDFSRRMIDRNPMRAKFNFQQLQALGDRACISATIGQIQQDKFFGVFKQVLSDVACQRVCRNPIVGVVEDIVCIHKILQKLVF